MAGRRKPVTFVVNERGCHICTSHAPGTDGYPGVWKDGRNQHLHRVLYEERHGPLDAGILARHTCDDIMFINVDHVLSGTKARNTAYATERGRHNPPRGERAGNTRLTAADIQVIRASTETQETLAQRYGGGQPEISKIKSGHRWSAGVCV